MTKFYTCTHMSWYTSSTFIFLLYSYRTAIKIKLYLWMVNQQYIDTNLNPVIQVIVTLTCKL